MVSSLLYENLQLFNDDKGATVSPSQVCLFTVMNSQYERKGLLNGSKAYSYRTFPAKSNSAVGLKSVSDLFISVSGQVM